MSNYLSVLVAEDEQLILEDVIEKVEKADTHFKVVASAMNGEDALKLVEQLKPDVLFTDIRMPVMDGLELIKNAKNIHPDIYVVILSGYGEFDYAQQAIKLGVTDYLLKPLRMDSLVESMSLIKNKLIDKINTTEENIPAKNNSGIKTAEALPSSLSNPSQKETGGSSRELFIKLEEYIRQNFSKPINVDSLAYKFNFSPYYIIRVFKKYKGEPPMQYLISLRINEAKRLIENNRDLDFKYISEIVGYTDQHYFSRVFKNVTGMSPSEYRDSFK